MNATQFLNSCLPLSKLTDDLDAVLTAAERMVQLDDSVIEIPPGTKVEVVVRTVRVYEFNMGFAERSAVLAIGGVKAVRHGVAEPRICFATLWYSAEGKFVTADFHTRLQ